MVYNRGMKISVDGPDFPVSFLNRLQDDDVVFFCGAGVSVDAGVGRKKLPDFGGLTKELFARFGAPLGKRDKRRRDYDRMLEELEREYTGVREEVRRILAPEGVVSPRRLENHRNLLKLASVSGSDDAERRVRLVTTNFDDRFQRAAELENMPVVTDVAPKLPMPEDGKEWASLVHLHGRIGDGGPDNLVLTSSDFGRAYLIQGWARRFVVQLLRKWHVAFVGYGLNDPPMRYLMDAAADIRSRDPDKFREPYAFALFREGREDAVRAEWEKKGVTPILCRKGKGGGAYSPLWKALAELAQFMDDPFESKKMLALKTTNDMPKGDGVERVIWALQDTAVSQFFAERKFFSGIADGEKFVRWLDVFHQAELLRVDNAEPAGKLALPPFTPNREPDFPPVASHLAYWAARHVHQPALLWWLARWRDVPHHRFIGQLARFVNRESGSKGREIPEELTEKWNLYFQERLAPPPDWRLFDDLVANGVKTEWAKRNMDIRILAALHPRPRLRASDWDRFNVEVDIGCEMDRGFPDAYFAKKRAKKPDFLAAHAETLSAHLEEAALLMRRCGIDSSPLRCFRPDEDDKPKPPHWLFLALLVRDAVLGMIKEGDVSRLGNHVFRWAASEHLLLRRLALFSLAETAKKISEPANRLPADWGALALTAHPETLWGSASQRESCRFLRKAGAAITPKIRRELESVVRNGPSRSMFRDNAPEADVVGMVRRKVAMLLAKLEVSGAELSPESARVLAAARAAEPIREYENFMEYPFGKAVTFQAADPDMPGFPGMPDREEKPKWTDMTIEQCAEYVRSEGRTWGFSSFVKEHPDKAVAAFEVLAEQKWWDVAAWSDFLGALDRNKDVSDALAVRLARLLGEMPDNAALGCVAECARVLQVVARTRPFSEIERVWRRAWNFGLDPRPTISGDRADQLTVAINHPHGMLAEIPLVCFGQGGDREKALDLLAEILASERLSHKYGKIIIGRCLFLLFKDCQEWTRRHLLPFFAPEHPMAFDMWGSFLYNPGMSADFLAAVKPAVLHFMKSPESFHDHDSNFMWIFISGCVRHPDVILPDERRLVGASMSPQGLVIFCGRLEWELRNEDSTERDKKWRKWMFSLLREVWPKKRPEKDASDISRALVSVVIRAGDAFPEAIAWAEKYLSPIDGNGHSHPISDLVWNEHDAMREIPGKFPEQCLLFLKRTVPSDGGDGRYRGDLEHILEKIKDAKPGLEKHLAFVRLRKIASGG